MDARFTGFTNDELRTVSKVLFSLSHPDKKVLMKHDLFGDLRASLRAFLGHGEEKKKLLKK